MLYATIEPTSQGNEPKKKNCLQTSSWYTKLQFLGKFPHVAIKVVLYYSNLSVRYYPHMYKVSLFYNILNKVSYDRKELYNALFESDISPVFFFLISLFFLFKQASRKKLGLIYFFFQYLTKLRGSIASRPIWKCRDIIHMSVASVLNII